MASNREMVGEFKDIVDKVIAHNKPGQTQLRLRGQQLRPQAPSVKLGDVEFMSAARGLSRTIWLGRRAEHVWGLAVRNQAVDQYRGSLAIVAIKGNGSSLIRGWDIDSPFSHIGGIRTERQLTDDKEIQLALEYARAPHLCPDNLLKLGELTVAETTFVSETMTRQKAVADEYASREGGHAGISTGLLDLTLFK